MTALWLRTTLRKQLLGHPRAMPGVWGRFALHRILPRKEFMGRAFEKCISFNALRLRFRLVASDFPGIVCILDGDRSSAVVLNATRCKDSCNRQEMTTQF